jgi:hypothetical protein
MNAPVEFVQFQAANLFNVEVEQELLGAILHG